uniref:Uncharacterized protein n=1 Tax=Trichobilharzia regenti TaxID=157069 RepID=A0AA85J097_TRIRE|nr:unnamed protein product [Trichobilharzia regenti]
MTTYCRLGCVYITLILLNAIIQSVSGSGLFEDDEVVVTTTMRTTTKSSASSLSMSWFAFTLIGLTVFDMLHIHLKRIIS